MIGRIKKGYQFPSARFNSAVDPHKQLWCSVLLQAVDDARGKGTATTIAECNAARNWLTEATNKWRSIVCDYAGICEESLVKMARGLYA